VQITDTVITLETLRESLPPGTISEYSAKQRLLDTMDIKLKRDVKPHITSDTSFDKLVEIAEKRDAIAHSTGLYGTRNQHTNLVSNAVTQPRTKTPETISKDTTNNPLIIPLSTIRYSLMRKKDAREKKHATIVGR